MKLSDYKLWTALVTPFMPGGEVDYSSLAKILKEQDEAKNGILLLGSTGEALNLDLETRKAIIDFALTQKLKSPLMVGVGGHLLQNQMAWTSWLETKNIDAYLMVAPIYAKPGDNGQYQWFKSLMDNVSRPVMLYNVPSRAGISLSLAAVKKLSSHPNFWAIKEASGSVAKFTEYLQACNQGEVYCGDDGLMSEFAAAGSCGLVSVASNPWPKQTHQYVKQCLKNKLQEKQMWKDASNSLFIASNPIPAKAILVAEGRISHGTMMPPLCETDLKDNAKLMNHNNNIKTWFKSQKASL